MNNSDDFNRPEIIHIPNDFEDNQVIIDNTKTYIRYDVHKKKLKQKEHDTLQKVHGKINEAEDEEKDDSFFYAKRGTYRRIRNKVKKLEE